MRLYVFGVALIFMVKISFRTGSRVYILPEKKTLALGIIFLAGLFNLPVAFVEAACHVALIS